MEVKRMYKINDYANSPTIPTRTAMKIRIFTTFVDSKQSARNLNVCEFFLLNDSV